MKKFFLHIMFIICVAFWIKPAENALAADGDVTIHMMYTAHSGYREQDMTMLTAMFYELTGIRVNIDYVPYEEQYEKIQELALTYDVLSLDQIWLADLVSKGIFIPLDPYLSSAMKGDLLPIVLNSFRYQQKIWAFPFLVNYQLLFYNTAMLEKAELTPPTTLDDMVDQMIILKEKGIVKYPWTDAWRQGENLLCEYVWLTGAFGGSLFDKDNNPIFDQGAGLKALEFMTLLIEQQLAHPNILTNDVIAAKNDFISGESAFTTNWVFLEGLLRYASPPQGATTTQEIQFKGEAGLIPVAKTVTAKSSSVSGFQGLGITAKPENQEASWTWIKFLTSPLAQRAFLYEMPIWTSVQTSEDTLMLDPLMSLKRTQLENVQHRPKLPEYPEISKVLQQALSLALKGQLLPAEALKAAKLEIEAIIKASAATTNEE